MLVNVPRRVNKRRVQQRRYDEYNIAGHNERPNRLKIVYAVEGKQCKQHVVYELAYQSREVVPEPQEPVPVPAQLRGKIPPFVIKPDIRELAYGVDQKRGYDKPGRIGENRFESAHVRIGGIGSVQKPDLADSEEEYGREYPDSYCLVSRPLPLALRQYVRNKERHRERQIPQRLRPSEGPYHQKDLDVRDDSRDRRKGVQP